MTRRTLAHRPPAASSRSDAAARVRRGSLVLLVAALVPLAAAAAEPRLGPSETKEVVFETRYQFYVRGYRRPVIFDPAQLRLGELEVTAGPDELALRLLAARARGEVETYSALMTEDRRRSMLDKLAREKTSEEELGERWRNASRGLHAELTHHVHFSIHRLIRYRLFDPAIGEPRETGELAFTIASDGRWRLFEPGAEHRFVLDNWRFDEPEKTLEVERADALAITRHAPGPRSRALSR